MLCACACTPHSVLEGMRGTTSQEIHVSFDAVGKGGGAEGGGEERPGAGVGWESAATLRFKWRRWREYSEETPLLGGVTAAPTAAVAQGNCTTAARNTEEASEVLMTRDC